MEYTRLTDKNHRYKKCAICTYKNCQYCDDYINYENECHNRLVELEDKIESGILREVPEGSVVLTKEEHKRLKGCENTIKRFSKISPTEAESENKALKAEIAIILAQKRNIWKLYNEEVAKNKQARKETAKEILKYLIESGVINTAPQTIRMYFKENYGVEL